MRRLLLIAASILMPAWAALAIAQVPGQQEKQENVESENLAEIDRALQYAGHAFKTKKYLRAIAYLRPVRNSRIKRHDIVMLLARSRYELGLQKYQAKKYWSAREQFRHFAKFVPQDSNAYLALGDINVKLRKHDLAKKRYLKAIGLNPKNYQAYLGLGVLHYNLHEADKAIAKLEIALRLVAGRPEEESFKNLLDKVKRDRIVDEGYKRETSPHFLVQYDRNDRSLSRYSREILAYLESQYRAQTRIFAENLKSKITVIFYSKSEFQKSSRAADWAGAYYDGRVRIPLDSWKKDKIRVQASIRHELTHAFLSHILPGASSWLHEGMAQWQQGLTPDTAKLLFRERPMFPAALMRGKFLHGTDSKGAAQFYGQSLILFSHILEQKRLSGIRRLIRRIAKEKGNSSEKEDAALKSLLGKDLDGLIQSIAKEHKLLAPPE